MVSEILGEIVHEASAEPVRLIAEVVQFVVLLAIVYIGAIGVGRRKGIVVNMLAERDARIRSRLVEASGAEQALADAHHEASTLVRDARREAREILAEAHARAKAIEATGTAEGDAAYAEALARAEETIARETLEMHMEIRDTLVETVAGATRGILNERLTVSEQRRSIQDAVSAALPEQTAARPS